MDVATYPDFYKEFIKRIFEQQMALLEEILTLPIDGFMFGDDFGYQD